MDFEETDKLNTIHVLTKMSTSTSINFRVSGCGIEKGCNISFPANSPVSTLKEEIFKLFNPKNVFASEGMKLILKGSTLDSNELIGEYTGTSPKIHQLLIMSSPMKMTKDITIHVKLPNKRSVSFDVTPNMTLRTAKEILHTHFQAPEPHGFELYSAKNRQPISNQLSRIDAQVKQLGEESEGTEEETMGDVILSASCNTFFLLPSALLVINGVNLMVTSKKMLDRTFPLKKTSLKNIPAKLSKKPTTQDSCRASNHTEGDVGPRPSRPAAHPKERKSKSRKGFAGLKRGFFTPEKKKSENKAAQEDVSSSEKTLLLAACKESTDIGPVTLDFRESDGDTPPKNVHRKSGLGQGQKKRCMVCNKRLLAWDVAAGQCRCGGSFCSKHGHFAEHNCAFDFATLEKDQLRERSTAGLSLSSGNYDHI